VVYNLISNGVIIDLGRGISKARRDYKRIENHQMHHDGISSLNHNRQLMAIKKEQKGEGVP